MKNYYKKRVDELFKEFNTSEKGLSNTEAKKKLLKYGKNIIKEERKFQPIKILLDQLKSFLIYILIIAAVISFFIGNNIDGFVISAIIVLNAGIGYFQQYKAEKAITSLKKLLIPKSKVIREGRMIEVLSSELVPGDVIVFESGDKVSADARIIESDNLQTNEAVLTGESFPVNKCDRIISKSVSLADQENMVFTGTQISRGTVKALVVATGMNSVFGDIAGNLQKIRIQKTPMQKRLDNFSKQIGVFILFLVGIVMLLGLGKQFDALNTFMISVALAVSAIPEGLPAVLTISFAISSLFMSKKNVIVRRLPAVESLGSVTVICSDKTGTLTEEKMSVQKIFANNNFYLKTTKNILLKNKKIDFKAHEELYKLLKTSILCNSARFEIADKSKKKYKLLGDPTEKALLSASLDLGLNKKTMVEAEPSVKKFEFDSKRKMMSIVRDSEKNYVMYSKGAIEKILSVSKSELINGNVKPLNLERKKEILEASKSMEKEAYRVLAFGYRNFNKVEKFEEDGLTFLGFSGMIDPPRKEVAGAVKDCMNAGIDVKIITGDSALTAKAIANQIGVKGRIVTEENLERMTDLVLQKSIHEIAVFARTTPTQKLRIAKALQSRKEVVAMTGDGINDVLALKAADIGIAMGKRGTDVARDVSDVVLVDDNFASIVDGVKQGRKTYDNIKKFTKYLLAVNFSGIFLILFSLVMGLFFGSDKWFLPLLPLQILWINLVTDGFPALSLIFEKEEDVMGSSPRKEKSILENIWKFIIIAGIFTFAVKLVVYVFGVNNDISEELTRTLILTTVVIFELLFVYTCRSNKKLLDIGIFSNKWLNYSVIFSIFAHLILLYTPLGNLFGVLPLSLGNWLLVFPLAISGLVVFETAKYLRTSKNRRTKSKKDFKLSS